MTAVGAEPGHTEERSFPRPVAATDRSRETGGLGLGLSLARRSAEAHHSLDLSREVGVGTRVTLTLPRAST